LRGKTAFINKREMNKGRREEIRVGEKEKEDLGQREDRKNREPGESL
jgi:hypothetical protein